MARSGIAPRPVCAAVHDATLGTAVTSRRRDAALRTRLAALLSPRRKAIVASWAPRTGAMKYSARLYQPPAITADPVLRAGFRLVPEMSELDEDQEREKEPAENARVALEPRSVRALEHEQHHRERNTELRDEGAHITPRPGAVTM